MKYIRTSRSLTETVQPAKSKSEVGPDSVLVCRDTDTCATAGVEIFGVIEWHSSAGGFFCMCGCLWRYVVVVEIIGVMSVVVERSGRRDGWASRRF